MKYAETYFTLNWHLLGEQGITKSKKILTIDGDGCEFLRSVECPFTLAIMIYMASHSTVSVINSDDMYAHFFEDSRMNMAFYEMVIDRLLQEKMISIVE
jgi:hypothetical protein